MNRDVEKLEEKIKSLEESIKEFENNHNKQVNNLIELFSDVIDIIKNREFKEDEEENKDKNYELNEKDYYYDSEYEEMVKNIQPKINIENNEFYGKDPREIVNTIINNAKANNNDINNSFESNHNNIEIKDDNKINSNIIDFNELKNEKPIFNLEEQDQSHTLNLEDLKMDLKPIEEESINIEPISPININDFKMDEIKISENVPELLKIEKSFSPVTIWIDTFKKTNKYLNAKKELSKYSIEEKVPNKKISLGDIVNLKSNSQIFTSQNLNIELGTIEEKGYDDTSSLLVMSINYVDNFNNEKTTFDLYNCKTIEERENMIKAEQNYVAENLTSKVSCFCVATKEGIKIGWIKMENLKEIVVNEMELI